MRSRPLIFDGIENAIAVATVPTINAGIRDRADGRPEKPARIASTMPLGMTLLTWVHSGDSPTDAPAFLTVIRLA